MSKEKKTEENTANNKLNNTKNKRIAFIRHGQAIHNINKDYWWVADNPLTKKGEEDLKKIQTKLSKDKNFYKNIELVITSPLLRALQTTDILFGNTNINIEVTTLNSEIYSVTCDLGTKKSILLKKYPKYLKWKNWNNINEIWWSEDNKNDNKRLELFKTYLLNKNENCIAVVGHSTFFYKLLGKSFNNGEIYWFDTTKDKFV